MRRNAVKCGTRNSSAVVKNSLAKIKKNKKTTQLYDRVKHVPGVLGLLGLPAVTITLIF